jgi:hypothetical protein
MALSAAMSLPALGQRPWSPVVASLLTLIALRLQAAALDPALHELLASVPTSLTELTTAAQAAGLAPAGPALLLRKPHPCSSCRMVVLVKHRTDSVASYIKAGDLVRNHDRRGQWLERPGVRDALMRPVPVVELLELP